MRHHYDSVVRKGQIFLQKIKNAKSDIINLLQKRTIHKERATFYMKIELIVFPPIIETSFVDVWIFYHQKY